MPIRIENLSKTYTRGIKHRNLAVDHLNLAIQRGEIFGFLGPNGAGKSTVIKILMNFIRPSSGSVHVDGLPVNDPASRAAVGYLPENPFFYDHLTAEEILSFGGRAARMSQVDIAGRIDVLLAQLKLSHVKKQPLRTYSKGMVQRIGLALALVHRPRICILDEPMSGLDPLGRRLVADMILEMRDNGQTVFFSSHILSDIEKLCDRVGILNHGRLLYCDSVGSLTKEDGGLEHAFIHRIEKDEKDHHGADLAAR
jgi:ABC-2 type transport system ATP-binding protein